MTGKEAVEPLLQLLFFMVNNEELCQSLQSGNGWGTYDDQFDFLSRLLIASIRNPNDEWKGD